MRDPADNIGNLPDRMREAADAIRKVADAFRKPADRPFSCARTRRKFAFESSLPPPAFQPGAREAPAAAPAQHVELVSDADAQGERSAAEALPAADLVQLGEFTAIRTELLDPPIGGLAQTKGCVWVSLLMAKNLEWRITSNTGDAARNPGARRNRSRPSKVTVIKAASDKNEIAFSGRGNVMDETVLETTLLNFCGDVAIIARMCQ